MNGEQLEQIKEIAAGFFLKSRIGGFEIKSIETVPQGGVDISVCSNEARYFIGENGAGIAALETLLRIIVKKQIPASPPIRLDVNNYRDSRDESLRELAKKAARRARFYKQPVALEAMPAYERRVIHTELASCPDIKTESSGEGLRRRVVVKFIE